MTLRLPVCCVGVNVFYNKCEDVLGVVEKGNDVPVLALNGFLNPSTKL